MKPPDQLIMNNGKLAQELQVTDRMEIKSFCHAVNHDYWESMTSKKRLATQESAVHNNQRSQCVMVFGVHEKTNIITNIHRSPEEQE